MNLPPYIYGREAGPNEKVYTEQTIREHGESCARMAREEAAKERRDLEEVLATIAAQSSGIPTSTSRADCMAALAAAAIRKG